MKDINIPGIGVFAIIAERLGKPATHPPCQSPSMCAGPVRLEVSTADRLQATISRTSEGIVTQARYAFENLSYHLGSPYVGKIYSIPKQCLSFMFLFCDAKHDI